MTNALKLRRNLAANAASQGVAVLLNLIVFPIYLRLLGSESYALIGFGLTVQIWINLLDLGLSPIFTRDMARMTAGTIARESVHRFLRTVDWLLAAMVVVTVLSAALTKDLWATQWFTDAGLESGIIGDSVFLIIGFSAIRLASTFYRSGLLGLEQQVFTSSVALVMNLVRLALPILVISYVRDVRIIFLFWLGGAVVEVVILRLALSRSFPDWLPLFVFSGPALKNRFSLGGQIALSALIWTATTQIDKLVLSRVLPLGEYGYFSLAVVLAGGLATIPAPIITAFQPQLTAAATTGDTERVRALMQRATQILTLTTLVPAILIAIVPGQAVLAWTGDATAAASLDGYLGAYLVATALLGLGGAIYALQVAYGNVRLTLVANSLFAAAIVPLIFVATSRAGAWGAAHLWLALTLILSLSYYPLVLHKLLPGRIAEWFALGILAPCAGAGAAAFAMDRAFELPRTQAEAAVSVLAVGGAGGMVALAIILATGWCAPSRDPA